MRLIRARNSKKRYYNQLRDMWTRKVEEIRTKAMQKSNKANKAIIEWIAPLLIANKPENAEAPLAILIRRLLEKYLYWCMLRYSIAFFQWRRKFKVKPIEDIKTAEDR